MTNAVEFFDGGLIGEPLPIDEAFSGIRIDGEVANLEAREVLEEVTSLRGRHPKIAEPGLDDHARPGDLVPCDRNAEPGIGRSPAAHADEQVRLVLGT